MKCSIENANLKVWNRVIHALSVTGDEDIHFSFTDSTLTLTAFDSTLAACAQCTFFRAFFQSYDVPRNFDLMFKVPSKCILKPFRSMRFLTKCCTYCEIDFDKNKDTIGITMGCKSGADILYTINLSAQSEVLSVEYDQESLKNHIKTEPKLIIGSLSNFAHSKGLCDLTLKVQGNKLLLKNCATDLVKKEGRIYTELSLNAVDFTEYSIDEDTEITFDLRPFKIFTSFAEHMKLPMSIQFHGLNDPVVLTVRNELLESTLMLATKVYNIPEGSQTSSQSSSVSNGRISNVPSQTPDAVANQEVDVEVLRQPEPSSTHRNQAVSVVEDIAVQSGALNTPECPEPVIEVQSNDNGGEPENRRETRKKKREETTDTNSVSPPTTSRPRKRFCDIFPNLGQPFDIYKAFKGHDIILVPGSDEEDD